MTHGTAGKTIPANHPFHRSLTAHLPPQLFARLRDTTILIAGLGGGSNIAELCARKGFGRFVLADPDEYEPHNIRQRGCLVSTLGRNKAVVMRDRLLDVFRSLVIEAVPDGVTAENAEALVDRADYVVDMIDFHGLAEKVALHRAARRQGKIVLTAPSVINGAVLFVFAPDGIPFWEFFEYEAGLSIAELGTRFLKRLIPRFPPDVPAAMYRSAARGERTIPLDAVGVEQASVLVVSALENLALGRRDRVIFVPRAVQIDVSDPTFLCRVFDFSGDFPPL